jgi:hypothetical protein
MRTKRARNDEKLEKLHDAKLKTLTRQRHHMNSHIAIVDPIIRKQLDGSFFSKDIDLGICCPKGKFCCSRCAHNLRFRGGIPEFCLEYDELIDRVASREKPVGTIPSRDKDPRLMEKLEARGLLVAQSQRNRWGRFVYVFTTKEVAQKRFSDFINLVVLKKKFGVEIKDKTIIEHARSKSFLNEEDCMIERGVVFGYPLWLSLSLQLGLNV